MDLASLTDVVASSPWAYAIVAAVAALDAVLPIVPSEATLIAAGAFAGAGELSLTLVIAAGAAGAFVGDSASYGIGRSARGHVARGPVRAAERVLGTRGGLVLIVARFIPGGRTAATLAAGMTMAAGRFARLAAAAAVIWGVYGAALGYAGGRTFEEEPWKGVVVGVSLAAALALILEAHRALARRHSGRPARVPTPC